MPRLSDIQGRIASMGELLSIVGAMRSLGGHARAGSAARAPRHPPLRRGHGGRHRRGAYAHGEAGARLAGAGRRRVLIVCMAEHGFVAGFNERIAEAAES